MRLVTNAIVILVCSLCAQFTFAAPSFNDVYPTTPDPFMGEYVGRWSAEEEVNPDIAAMVYPIGGGEYHIRLVTKLDVRCPIILDIDLKPKKGKLEFEEGALRGETDGRTFTGARNKRTFTMQKVERVSPTEGRSAPEGATILFDGKGLDAWQSTEGWEVTPDGALMVTPKGKNLFSVGKWTDFEMHVEFRLPIMAASRGQSRGNSGVFSQGLYEVQVLDSFGLNGVFDECGALYKLAAPHVNACYPPLRWQTYDILYTAPQYGPDGKLAANGRITVRHNGVLIHNDQELLYITDWTEGDRLKPAPSEPGPIKIQAHNNFMQYRNIWLVDRAPAK